MQTLTSIKGMDEFLSHVNTAIKTLLVPLSNHPAHEPLAYFFQTPGKMLRPMLTFTSCSLLGEPRTKDQSKNLVTLACGLELLHNASLIHDDILDQSPARRGQPALHIKFSPKMALLCGDLLYSMALDMLRKVLPGPQLGLLLHTTAGMCLAEIQALSPLVDMDAYLDNLEKKTARLFHAACVLAAFLSGAKEPESEALGSFGLQFGLLYQLLDDHKDQDNPWTQKIHLGQKCSELSEGIQESLQILPPGETRDIVLRFLLLIGQKFQQDQQ